MTDLLQLDNGIYDNIPEEDYFRIDALSSSDLRTLANDTATERLLWNKLRPASTAQKFGRASHKWILEGEEAFMRAYCIIGDDYRTKEYKEAKNEALESGLTPIKHADYEKIVAMGEQIKKYCADNNFDPFVSGKAEIVLIWTDTNGMKLKARLDFLPDSKTDIMDYKTCRSITDAGVRNSVQNYGYHMQLALYREGLQALGIAKSPDMYLLLQEKETPYPCRIVAFEEWQIEFGYALNQQAKHIYIACQKNGFEGYPIISIPFSQAYIEHKCAQLNTDSDKYTEHAETNAGGTDTNGDTNTDNTEDPNDYPF